jgi:hypothetical protein
VTQHLRADGRRINALEYFSHKNNLLGDPRRASDQIPSFRAGAYSVDQFLNFGHRAGIFAAEQLRLDENQIQYTYRLFFADRMTNLRRALVTAVVSTGGHSDLPLARTTSSGVRFKTEQSAAFIPDDLVHRVESMLLAAEIPSHTIHLRLEITHSPKGQFIKDAIAESRMVTRGPDAEQTIFQIAPDMNIRTFAVSQVYFHRRDGSCYYVEVESQYFALQLVPFSASGESTERRKFFEDIKRRCVLQDCPVLAPFGGLVLDDHTSRIEAYLHDAPAYAHIRKLLESAIERGLKIPCEIIQMWISQLIGIVAKLHSLGVIIGFLTLADFDVDHNGDVLLSSIKTAGRSLDDQLGNLSPELRDCGKLDVHANVSYRTDIFQLGQLIWQIAEHLPRVTNYAFCKRSACSSRPCYNCTAEHTNPVALPPCQEPEMRLGHDGEMSIDMCITHCRQADPELRLPAHQLQQLLPRRPRPVQLETWLSRFSKPGGGLPRCNECAIVMPQSHYHCDICD